VAGTQRSIQNCFVVKKNENDFFQLHSFGCSFSCDQHQCKSPEVRAILRIDPYPLVRVTLWFALPHTGHSWIFEPVNLTDFSQFSSISPGNFRNWVVLVFLSFPSHFTGSFVPLITQKSPFSEAFHHFHTDNTHHFELIGSNPSMAVQTTVVIRSLRSLVNHRLSIQQTLDKVSPVNRRRSIQQTIPHRIFRQKSWVGGRDLARLPTYSRYCRFL
jgi:hypothetical protein